jgi:hypothetical protein
MSGSVFEYTTCDDKYELSERPMGRDGEGDGDDLAGPPAMMIAPPV